MPRLALLPCYCWLLVLLLPVQLLNLLAALTVLQLVGWAPTFFVDYALVK